MATHRYWAEHLVEFRHAWKLPWSALLAYWAWLALFVVIALGRLRTSHAALVLCAVVFAGGSLMFVRMVFAFGIVSAPLMAADVSNWLASRSRSPARSSSKLAQTVFVIACLLAPVYVYRDHKPGIGLSAWMWPTGQFAFVRRHALRGRAFVSDAWAGPFLGEFYPERKAFFDNRLEAYSDHLARDVYQTIRYGAPGWDQLLARYDVQFLILRYTTASEARLQPRDGNLRQRLARDPRFSLVYFDDVGALFVRRAGDNAGLAERYAMPGVDPDRRMFIGRPSAAATGLVQAGQRGMLSSTALGLTALALADLGDVEHARLLAQAALDRAPEDAFAKSLPQRVTQLVKQP
jgi:hypothetical protein